MKIQLSLFFCLAFSLVFSQLSEIKEIDKQFEKEYKQIEKDFGKKSQRNHFADKVNDLHKRTIDAYEKVIITYQEKEKEILPDPASVADKSLLPNYGKTGINDFRKVFSQNFDTSMINDDTGTYKTILKFIIDENGNVKNVKAEGENREFNILCIITLYKLKNDWTPAYFEGKPINSSFVFPITLNIE